MSLFPLFDTKFPKFFFGFRHRDGHFFIAFVHLESYVGRKADLV